MPATLLSQPWDSVTAPALPAGWTIHSDYDTSTTLAVSASNSLRRISTAGGRRTAIYDTAETVGGMVQVSSAFRWVGVTGGNTVQWGLIARYVDDDNYLVVRLEPSASADPGVRLYSRVAAADTEIASVSGTLGILLWYTVILECNGTSIRVYVQRQSNSTWLDSAGSFSAGRKACIDATVTANYTAGKYGLESDQTIGEADAQYADDFLSESLTDVLWWRGSFAPVPRKAGNYRASAYVDYADKTQTMELAGRVLDVYPAIYEDSGIFANPRRRSVLSAAIASDYGKPVYSRMDFGDSSGQAWRATRGGDDVRAPQNPNRDPLAWSQFISAASASSFSIGYSNWGSGSVDPTIIANQDFDPRIFPGGRRVFETTTKKQSPHVMTQDVLKDLLDVSVSFTDTRTIQPRSHRAIASQVGVGDVQKELFKIDVVHVQIPDTVSRKRIREGIQSMQRREIPETVIDVPPPMMQEVKANRIRVVKSGDISGMPEPIVLESVPLGWNVPSETIPHRMQSPKRQGDAFLPDQSALWYSFAYSWHNQPELPTRRQKPRPEGKDSFVALQQPEVGQAIDWYIGWSSPTRIRKVGQGKSSDIGAVSYGQPVEAFDFLRSHDADMPRAKSRPTESPLPFVREVAEVITDEALFHSFNVQQIRPRTITHMRTHDVQILMGVGYTITIDGPFYCVAGQIYTAGAVVGQVRSGG